MVFPIECSCGKRFEARSKLIGKTVACPACSAALTIRKPANRNTLSVRCDCGSGFKAPAYLAGESLPCPSCGGAIAIPVAGGKTGASRSTDSKTQQKPEAPSKAKAPSKAQPTSQALVPSTELSNDVKSADDFTADDLAADDFATDDFDEFDGGFEDGFGDDDPLGSGGDLDEFGGMSSEGKLAKAKPKRRKGPRKEINMPLVIGGIVGLGIVGLMTVIIMTTMSDSDDEPIPNRQSGQPSQLASSASENAARASEDQVDRDEVERDSSRNSEVEQTRRSNRNNANVDSNSFHNETPDRSQRLVTDRPSSSGDDARKDDHANDEGQDPAGGNEKVADDSVVGSKLLVTYEKWSQRPGANLIGAIMPDDEESLISGHSWMSKLLPHLGYQDIYDKIDYEKSWTSKENFEQSVQVIPEFLNPLDDRRRWEGYPYQGMGLTHFAGVSGVAKKRTEVAAKLKRSHPQAGVFGYREILPASKIGDGASHTISIIGSGELAGPWAAAGGSTIRGARAPYFDGMSGFGSRGSAKPGAVALRADGSASFVSAKIDSKVFAAMCTANGGEGTVDESDWLEPPTVPKSKRRKFRRTTVNNSDDSGKTSGRSWSDGEDEDE